VRTVRNRVLREYIIVCVTGSLQLPHDCISVYQYNEINMMHFLFNLLELRASTCFEHYLLILRRRRTKCTWYTEFMLCLLAAPGLELRFNPGAAN
jgi:hypothetical protein